MHEIPSDMISGDVTLLDAVDRSRGHDRPAADVVERLAETFLQERGPAGCSVESMRGSKTERNLQ